MPLSERFGHGQGLTLGVQIRAVSGVTTFSVTSVTLFNTDLDARRRGQVLLTVDGDNFQIDFHFTDEVYEGRTLTGQLKRKQDDQA